MLSQNFALVSLWEFMWPVKLKHVTKIVGGHKMAMCKILKRCKNRINMAFSLGDNSHIRLSTVQPPCKKKFT